MTGRDVNDGQARQCMRKDGLAVETAAAKAGFSRATEYRLEGDPRLPSEKRQRRNNRHPDPLGGLFERVAAALLERNPGCRRWRSSRSCSGCIPNSRPARGGRSSGACGSGRRCTARSGKWCSCRSTARVVGATRTSPRWRGWG